MRVSSSSTHLLARLRQDPRAPSHLLARLRQDRRAAASGTQQKKGSSLFGVGSGLTAPHQGVSKPSPRSHRRSLALHQRASDGGGAGVAAIPLVNSSEPFVFCGFRASMLARIDLGGRVHDCRASPDAHDLRGWTQTPPSWVAIKSPTRNSGEPKEVAEGAEMEICGHLEFPSERPLSRPAITNSRCPEFPPEFPMTSVPPPYSRSGTDVARFQ